MKDFKRTFMVGKVPGWRRNTGEETLLPLWITVEYANKGGRGRLSITGVHGPMTNGDCHGSCGQCTDTLRDLAEGPEENINMYYDGTGDKKAFVRWLLEVWDAWHLNDMRAACEHQEKVHKWDPCEALTVYRWELTSDVLSKQNQIKRLADERLLAGESVQLSEEERELLNRPFWFYAYDEDARPEGYVLKDTKQSSAGQLHPLEHAKGKGWPTREHCHPKGLLCKPCPTCGHAYGSKWLYTPVPEDVLACLASLPDQYESYPWKR